MDDETRGLPSPDNIRGLVQDLAEKLDARMDGLRAGTPFEHVRPGDAKTFMLISRHPRSISQLARALRITRQAAHNSIRRLIDKRLVALESAPGSQREKIPVVTRRGHAARRKVARSLELIETELAAEVGTKRLEELRNALRDLVASFEKVNQGQGPGGRGSV